MNVRLEEKILTQCNRSNGERAVWWRGAWWSRKVLADLAAQYETRLKESGFKEGNRIAVLMPNCPAFLAMMIAVWKAGGTVTPLNLQAGLAPTVEALVHSDVSAVFAPQGMDQITQGLAASGLPAVGVPLDGPLPSFQSRTRERSDPEIAVLFYTSGTTGSPKGVPITHSNLHDNVTKSITISRTQAMISSSTSYPTSTPWVSLPAGFFRSWVGIPGHNAHLHAPGERPRVYQGGRGHRNDSRSNHGCPSARRHRPGDRTPFLA